MRTNIRLFIGGMEVQFKTEPDIVFNYASTELTNPTIVKNSFSKTITIEGTPDNNKIFGQFWDLERVQGSNKFNPSQKTPFVLYVNGEICESGYVKLDEVIKKKNFIEYKITLYGGLGDFFYLLSFNENGEQLKLSDLDYTNTGGANEFDFTIDKETVNLAWNSITGNTSSKWKYINFAPAYNGNPNGITADKVIINFTNNELANTVVSGDTTYSDIQGYGMGTLPAEVDEWAVRDLRSWNQRPVIKMSEIIKACERYAGRQGYTVNYDNTFFNTDNPYWNDAWLTLPKLDEININGSGIEASSTFYPVIRTYATYNGWYETVYTLGDTDIPFGTGEVQIDLNPIFDLSTFSQSYISPIADKSLYSSCYANGEKNFNGFLIQVIGYEGSDSLSKKVAASDAIFITSKVGEEYLDIANEVDVNNYVALNRNYSNVFGTFEPIGNYCYRFSSPLSFNIETNNKINSYAIRVICIANTESINASGTQAITFGNRRGNFYTATTLNSIVKSGSSVNTVELRHSMGNFADEITGYTYAESDTAGFSGAKLNKKRLLDTEYSPCDYLLSYCKLFGLYFYKKPSDKIIHIMTRTKFYQTGNTINLEELIDRGSDNTLTPIAFESKWYDMQLENVEGEFAKKYKTTYGRNYGIQRINTGYNFDSNSTDLYEGNTIKGAVECTEKSRYYVAPVDTDNNFNVPYYYWQGMTYNLYDAEGNTIDITPQSVGAIARPMKSRKYYDAFSKVQLRDENYKAVDGENVLLFFNGLVSHTNDNGDVINYYLTDDMSIMGQLNDGQACWLSTTTEYDTNGDRIAFSRNLIPEFGRYTKQGDFLMNSWDFGSPKELFIPDAVMNEDNTIYYNYWQKYLEDMYDINTRVFECPVLLKGKPSSDWLRNFYWFDNSIWVISKITDWKVNNEELTKVQFIKVQDKSNYQLAPVSDIPAITLSANTTSIPLAGGSIGFTVSTLSGTKWSGTTIWQTVGGSKPTGTGSRSFNFTVNSYAGTSRSIAFTIVGEQGQYSNSVVIRQGDYNIQVSSDTRTFAATGGTGYISITADTNWEIETEAIWEGETHPDFLSLSQRTGNGNAVITVNCPPTTMETSRQEYIYVNKNGHTYGQLLIAQLGADYFHLTPDEDINAPAESEGIVYTRVIDTNVSGWTVVLDEYIYDSSLSENTEYAAGTYTHTFKIRNNTDGHPVRFLGVTYMKDLRGLGTVWVQQEG